MPGVVLVWQFNNAAEYNRRSLTGRDDVGN